MFQCLNIYYRHPLVTGDAIVVSAAIPGQPNVNDNSLPLTLELLIPSIWIVLLMF